MRILYDSRDLDCAMLAHTGSMFANMVAVTKNIIMRIIVLYHHLITALQTLNQNLILEARNLVKPIADAFFSTLSVLLVVVVLAVAQPEILDFEGEDHQHHQEGDAGDHVEGSYSWTSPEGEEFHVQYVADEDGYRVLESNAVPVNHDGMAADGNQGAFGEEEGEGGER
ncbi:uncharacterized protein [Penaeus vannamei]|uniref:uncharacterized protein n=1 Tax=Penaeus vannamei TaxID=6689 RepID=UPI00387F714E